MSHNFGHKLPYDFHSFGKKLSHPHNMFTKMHHGVKHFNHNAIPLLGAASVLGLEGAVGTSIGASGRPVPLRYD